MTLKDPKFRTAFLPETGDARAFFHEWLKDGGGKGDDFASFFHIEKSFWEVRSEASVLLVHYLDLMKDRASEMRRIAKFLGISISESLWPELVEAASLDAMRAQGKEIIPQAHEAWQGGAAGFLQKGRIGGWREVLARQDLERYDTMVREQFSPELARWVEQGRLVAGDPERTR